MIKYRKQKLMKLKFILALLLVIVLCFQIYFIVTLVKYNTRDYRDVSVDEYGTLSPGDEIRSSVSKEQVMFFFSTSEKDGEKRNIAVSDINGRIFVLSAKQSEISGNFENIKEIAEGNIDSFSFKGKAEVISGGKKNIVINAIGNKRIAPDRIILQSDITDMGVFLNDSSDSQETSLMISSVIGVGMTVALIILLLWKSVNNFIYGYLVSRGKIEPELKIRKEDIIIQNDKNYSGSDNDSDSFYVNTEHEIPDANGGSAAENTDGSGNYHFTKRMRDNVNGSMNYERNEPTFSDGSPIDFYSGGVNDDGNFYVDESNTKNVDSEGNEIKKY